MTGRTLQDQSISSLQRISWLGRTNLPMTSLNDSVNDRVPSLGPRLSGTRAGGLLVPNEALTVCPKLAFNSFSLC